MAREDVRVLEKLNGVIEECRRDPFRGTGKPEPLRKNLSGWWSRRITGSIGWCIACAGPVRRRRSRC